MTAKPSMVNRVSGLSAVVAQRRQRRPRDLGGCNACHHAHTNMFFDPIDIPHTQTMAAENRNESGSDALISGMSQAMSDARAWAHHSKDEEYFQILNAGPEQFTMGPDDFFPSQEHQFTEEVGISNSNVPLLPQDSNGGFSESESLLPQLDDLGSMPPLLESLDDTHYHYFLVEKASTEHYNDEIGKTEVDEAYLEQIEVESECKLEKLKILVAAKEREKKAESQTAQNEGSAFHPQAFHGQSNSQA